MHKWVLLLCFAALGRVGCLSSHDALSSFYQAYGSAVASQINSSDLCRWKWGRTEALFGRHSDTNLTRNKGLTGIGDEYHTYQGKRILIVHVGKAAGGTVNKALLTAGVRSRQIHMHALDAQMIDEHDCILLCLRNPVQRTISAFNWRVPGGRNVSEGFAFKQCGIGNYEEFYTCCRSIEEYAARLSEFSTCGSIARQGECHTELDTCAYVGGVVHELERQRSKVFAIDTSTIQSDLNTISRHLGWGKRFDRLPRIHEYEKKINLTQLSATGLKSITTFVEVTGEASLYRKLLSVFKLQQ